MIEMNIQAGDNSCHLSLVTTATVEELQRLRDGITRIKEVVEIEIDNRIKYKWGQPANDG